MRILNIFGYIMFWGSGKEKEKREQIEEIYFKSGLLDNCYLLN